MISETLLVPIISGGCVILSGCIERLMNLMCPELRKKTIALCCKRNNTEDSDEEDEINSPATCVLKLIWEEPNINKNVKYTSKINNNQHYSIEIPHNSYNACVNVYDEFSKKSETGRYYLNVKLSNIDNNNVKIFIKRFREKGIFNREWVPSSFKPFEYIKAKNGINRFTSKSLIGVNDVLHEQLGVMIESNTESYSKCLIERAYLENKPMCNRI